MWSGETRCSQPPSVGDAVHVHHVGADPVDRGAHAGQQPREVLDVRLGRRVADDGRAGRQRGRHQRVLRAHHRRLVHEEVARPQAAVGRAQADVAAVLDVRSERAERVQVRIQAAAPDHVAAGRRQQRLAEAGEQRPGDQERGADLLGQVGVDVGLGDRVGLQGDDVPVAPVDLHAEILQQHDQGLGVADPGHVPEHDLLVREQARGQQRQGRVLVAGGHDGAGQRHAAFDDELFHQGWQRRGRTGVGPARKLG